MSWSRKKANVLENCFQIGMFLILNVQWLIRWGQRKRRKMDQNVDDIDCVCVFKTFVVQNYAMKLLFRQYIGQSYKSQSPAEKEADERKERDEKDLCVNYANSSFFSTVVGFGRHQVSNYNSKGMRGERGEVLWEHNRHTTIIDVIDIELGTLLMTMMIFLEYCLDSDEIKGKIPVLGCRYLGECKVLRRWQQ